MRSSVPEYRFMRVRVFAIRLYLFRLLFCSTQVATGVYSVPADVAGPLLAGPGDGQRHQQHADVGERIHAVLHRLGRRSHR